MTIEQEAFAIAVAPPEPDHAQWRLATIQLVNWGGFHGHHTIAVSVGSTLITGGSGVGKSTLLDAWIALVMPSDVDFNGASNDTGIGRARAPEKRNLLSYLRGKQDRMSDGSGRTHELVLRGKDRGPVWGALACTFANDNGRKYTVMRTFFAKAGAKVASDVTTTFAASNGSIDLSRLEPLAATRFDKRTLKNALPGLETFKSFSEFEENLHARLGIGGGDGGRKAMRLLARVQAGMQVNRVDELYKSMVLEKPVTYRVADDALAHFADLKTSYLKMVDEADKLNTLRRLPALQQEFADAQARVELIGDFGADRDGPTPFKLWRLRTERALLDEAVGVNRRYHKEQAAKHAEAERQEAEYQRQLDRIAEDKRANGGDTIDERRRRISDLRRGWDGVYAANIRFQERTNSIGLVVPETAEQFAEAQAAAAEFLAGFDARQSELQSEEETIREEQLAPLTTRQRELFEERKSLQGRSGAVPMGLHNARVRMAQAAGLDAEEDLPFVAELIDVLPDQARWRKAVETTLGGIARTVLVDRRTLDRLSAAIDAVVIRPRIRFQAVSLAEHEDWRGDPDYVSGKLAFKASPFSRWVQDRVSDDGTDHLCVTDAASLDGSGPRVTPSGQTRHGDRGAHGESRDGAIIGFSNERRLADIEALLAELDPRVAAVRDQIATVHDRLADLGRQKEAHVYVQDSAWESIDHLGIDRRIGELEDEIRRLREANEILDALEAEEERVRPLHQQANRDRVLTANRVEDLDNEHAKLVDSQDSVQNRIDEIDTEQSATVSEEQWAYLDKLFSANWDAADLRGFDSNTRALRTRLKEEAGSARRRARSATSAMEAMFEQYKARWTEHNLGTSVDSADGYREILDRIESEGLHARRDKWRREFTAWSSDDLLRLNDAFDTALEDIEDRLRPVNRILEALPFGGKGYLQIELRRVTKDNLIRFRRSLRELSSGLALELTERQIENRFTRLSEFMSMIGIPEGHSKSSTAERDRLLDVRQHVSITARVIDEHGNEVATYDYIGDKSGGEMQELVAFIVGSALRYQLGDEERSRPRFAPVFLDEAFIKADGEFSGRAVKAWQDLGFQLIVGAPLDKFTSLERPMDLLLQVNKNSRSHSFVTDFPDGRDPV